MRGRNPKVKGPNQNFEGRKSSSSFLKRVNYCTKIPGAWLVKIKDAGHALFMQYPDKFNRVLQTFLSTTTPSS
jgi:pimeloyl-ACP methyl ester carboxylesterase